MSTKRGFAPATVGAAMLVAASAVTGFILSSPKFGYHGAAIAQERAVVAPEKLEAATDLSTAFRQVAESIQPSVVSISTTIKPKQVRRRGPSRQNIPPEFRQLFPEAFGDESFQTPGGSGLGSGVIVRADGYILTNNHVVEGADELSVTLSDGREIEGKVVGTDPQTDLAVVKVDASGLTPAAIGDSDALRVGDWVVAIGSPFGLDQTVTAGIISAKHRSRQIVANGEGYEDFLQTDAAINPGNSGGPLVNLRGEVIGINTAIESRSGGFAGIGFAIPSGLARPILESIIKDGKVHRGLLGAQVGDVTREVAERFGGKVGEGVLISGVVNNKPAAKAGIQPGDIVLEANGKPTNNSSQFRNYIATTPPGSKVALKIRRGDEMLNVNVVLEELTADVANSIRKSQFNVPSLGLAAETLNEDTAEKLGLDPDTVGVLVRGIDPEGDAAAAGIQAGDVISQVNNQPVNNPTDLERLIKKNRDEQKRSRLLLERGDMRAMIVIQ